MNEEEKSKLGIIVIVLLIVIIFLQVIHFIKLHEISLNSQLTNLAIYGNNMRRDFRNEMSRFRDNERNFRHHLERREIARTMKNNAPIVKNKKYDEKKQVYTLEIAVPKDLTKDDIAIDFKNNTLAIAFAGVLEIQDQENSMTDNFSVYRFFETPETKAKLKDIKYDVNNGLLTVVVPIIK